jgi:hypothetical protein
MFEGELKVNEGEFFIRKGTNLKTEAEEMYRLKG